MTLCILFQCLSSTVGFGFGCSYIARYEEQGIGSQWSNIQSSPIPEDEFSLSSCMWMMVVDSAIYLIITWYVEAVFPGRFLALLFAYIYICCTCSSQQSVTFRHLLYQLMHNNVDSSGDIYCKTGIQSKCSRESVKSLI